MAVGLGIGTGGFTDSTHPTNTSTTIQPSGSGVTGIVGGLTNLAQLGVDIWSTYETMKQAEKNYELQQKTLKYSKNLQNRIFEREDNAVLRRSLDLQRAGLSKTLAAGSSAGAGTPIAVNTPQKNVDYKMPRFDVQQRSLDLLTQKATIDKTFAENEYLKMQREKAEADKLLSLTRNKQAEFDYMASVRSGIPSNSSTPGKMIKDARGYVGLLWEQTKNSASTLKNAVQDTAGKLKTKAEQAYKKNWR